MPAEILVTRDILAEDTVFILQCLRESHREGRSMHMLDVRNYLANSVTLEFSDYLRFLRKYGYVVLDREQHTLGLTAPGDQAAQADPGTGLLGQLDDHFADKLKKGVIEVQTEEEERANLAALAGNGSRPPPPPDEEQTPGPGPAATFAALAASGADATHAESDELIYLRGEAIGQGPMGTVYRARHASLGTDIAVKEIREAASRRVYTDPAQLAARLKAELSVQARLRHPAVVALYDLDLTVPQPFAVLELCGGGNLRDRLLPRGGQGLPAEFVLRAFGQLLAGLAHAHALGVTHHNLKPENILFDAFGNAKLSDFGLGRLLQHDLGDQRTMVIDAGNMSYRSPELLQGGKAGPSADVYALGFLLYEALTGRVPGRRSALPSKAAPGVPADFDDIFDRMTADRPEERYETAGDALEDICAAFPDGRYGQPGMVWVHTAPWVEQAAPAEPPKAAVEPPRPPPAKEARKR